MKTNWAAIGIVTSISLASLSGVSSLVNAAQIAKVDITTLQIRLDNMDKNLISIKSNVDFIFQHFFDHSK